MTLYKDHSIASGIILIWQLVWFLTNRIGLFESDNLLDALKWYGEHGSFWRRYFLDGATFQKNKTKPPPTKPWVDP